MTDLSTKRHRPFGPKAECFRELLQRYPELADDQIEKMIAIYPQLTILELALFAADGLVADRFDSFVRGHSDRLRSSWQQRFIFGAAYISALALLFGLSVGLMR